MRLVRLPVGRDFENIMSQFLDPNLNCTARVNPQLASSQWNPAVDFKESENEFFFTVELPGFEKNEVEIVVNNGILSISGERTFDEENRGQYRRIERLYGKFNRSFRLPDTVDAGKIEAHLNNGLLSIRIPRKEEALPRQIPVTVS